jgi:hypothetical protein
MSKKPLPREYYRRSRIIVGAALDAKDFAKNKIVGAASAANDFAKNKIVGAASAANCALRFLLL